MKNQDYESIQLPPQLSDAVRNGIRQGKKRRRRKALQKISAWGSMAAAVLLFFTYCFQNPTFAAELPLIGSVFARFEDKSDFKGDYSEKAKNLSEEPKAKRVEGKDETSAEIENPYGDTDQKITITPLEVYCDGSSLYLTMELENEQENGFGQDELAAGVEGYTLDYSQMQLMGTWSDGTATHEFSEYLIGEQSDNFHFSGRMKILTEGLAEKTETLQLQITDLFWIDVTKTAASYATDSGMEGRHIAMRGEWNLEIPIQVSSEQTQAYAIHDKNESGFGIEEVTVTPYEIRVTPAVPAVDTQRLEQIYTEFQNLCAEKLGEEEAAVFLQDAWLNAQEPDWHGGFAVFDQNGERLAWGTETQTEAVYQTSMKKLEKLYFYLMPDAVTAYKCTEQEKAEKCNLYSYELDLQNP